MRRLLSALLLCAACAKPAPPAAIAYFRATPEIIPPGDSAELEWSASGVSSCRLQLLGEVPAVGSLTVAPDSTTTYILSCGSTMARLQLDVRPRVSIDAFTATPPDTSPDSFVALRWSTSGATECSINHDVGSVPISGAVDVQPEEPTAYTLTCQGFGGPVRATTSVAVTPVTSLEVPTDVQVTPGDGEVVVSWRQAVGAGNVYLAEASGLTRENVSSLPGGRVVRKVRSPLELTGLVNGRTYFLRVAAASGAVESDLSAEQSAAPVAAPPEGDPYFPAQWHLASTGQSGATPGEDIRVEGAWASARGEGVRIAVVDEGVDLGHADLRTNVVQQQSFDYLGTSEVRLAEHGTCVAGLAAARDLNGVGLRGVAPRAALVSYNVLQDLTSANEYDAMVRGADVNGASNNSWGDVDDGTGLLSTPDPLWLRGVEQGTRLGRGGKGVVYLWAAGNGAAGRYRDDSNYDGQANRRFVLAIGGVGDDGQRASYSESGANVLAVAPTEGRGDHALTTTDLTGAAGFNRGGSPGDLADPDYTQLMNGTSASTPVATGVVALVLQANPALTWRDVRRVLAMTARKNDPTDPDWAVNGAGLHVNHQYGFGVLDATAAVALARTFPAGAPELSFSTPLRPAALAIPDGDATGVSSAIEVVGSGIARLDFVEVVVTATHAYSGQLELALERQGGLRDVLHVPHWCQPDKVAGVEECSALTGYTFGVVRHLDEPADGRWTLRVKDLVAGTSGALVSWRLNFFGRP